MHFTNMITDYEHSVIQVSGLGKGQIRILVWTEHIFFAGII